MKAIFLDDERFPKTSFYEWIVIRSAEEVMEYILKNGCPSYISFDNDLGDGLLEGIDLAHWLVEQDLDSGGTFIPEDFDFNIHSANSIAGPRIQSLLSSFLKHKGN